MAQLSRLKDSEISNGNLINADDLDAEFNQLLNESNDQDTRLDTIEGAYVSASGTNAFTGNNSFASKVQIKDKAELTISSGAVTATGSNHTIDTESDGASDDLATINGGVDGMLLYLQAENGARTVVLKHNTGNIYNPSGLDISLDDEYKIVHLIYSSALTKWVVNGEFAASATASGIVELATTAETQTGTDATRAVTPDGLQGALLFSHGVQLDDQTITAGGSLTLAHGLPSTPKLIMSFLVCTTAEFNYSIGDVVEWVGASHTTQSSAASKGHSFTVDGTNINVRFGAAASTYIVINKTTGAPQNITNGSWTLRILAWA